jgi:hypothetical protein
MKVIRSLLLLVWFIPPAHAQITGEIRVNVPFPFYIQETKLPPGNYVLRPFQDSDNQIMELQSEDGKTAVTFPVNSSQMKNAPAQTEVFFHRYGNNEYLSRIFESDSAIGSRVVMTRSELSMQKNGTKPEEHAVHAEKQ